MVRISAAPRTPHPRRKDIVTNVVMTKREVATQDLESL